MKFFLKLLFGLVVVVVSAIAFVGLRTQPEPTPTAPQPNSAELYGAASKLLRDQLTSNEIKILMLVMGGKDDASLWNFRGSLDRASRNMPFYGSLRSVCPEFTSLACWQLASLTIDGQSYPIFSSDPAQATPSPAVGAAPISAKSAAMTGGTAVTPSDSTREKAPTKRAADLATTLAPRKIAETWYTKTESINARTGPGTEYPVAFQISPKIQLNLIETKGGWGKFSYPAQGGATGQVWISMGLVEKR